MRRLRMKSGFFAYYNTAWFLAAVTFCSYMLLPHIGYRAIGPIYLVSILAVASLGGNHGPTLFAAVLSALCWDFFFIPPRFTLVISNFEDAMMVLSFFGAALAGGYLTSTIKDQEEILSKKEERTRELYELGRWLVAAKTQTELLEILTLKIEKLFPHGGLVLLKSETNGLHLPEPKDSRLGETEMQAAEAALSGRSTGWSTPEVSAANCLCLPMRGNSGVLGVVVLFPDGAKEELSLETEDFLATVIGNVAIALERLRFSEAAANARIYENSEKLHQTLLNSISHEMRTPLTVIVGSATLLSEKSGPPEFVRRVAAELAAASDRLNRVIENLLDMSRLNSGVMALKLEWHDLNDLVRAAVAKLGGNLSSHEVRVQIQPSLPPVKVDFRLLEHALSNLVLNAALYAPEGTPIDVSVSLHGEKLLLSVTDAGPGIPVEAREKIFDKFYRVPGTKAGGTGLGLSIVKGIVEIHHGQVHVEAAGQGSRFVIEIPTSSAPGVSEEANAGSNLS